MKNWENKIQSMISGSETKYTMIYFIRTLNIINDLINTTGKKAYI